MNKKRIFFISLLLLILSFTLVGCFSAKTPENNQNVTLDVLLTDRPISDVASLTVYIKDMYFTYDLNGESHVSTPVSINKEYDILSLAGTEVSLFNFEIPEGAELETIHMDVNSEATIVVNGLSLKVAVNANGKIIIPNVGIEINNDGELVLDFDVASSLKSTGTGFRLIPVLKPTFRRKNAADLFTIQGKIFDHLNNDSPVSKAVITLSSTPIATDESTILRVTLSNKDGEFYLGKHSNGEYDINVYKDITLPDNDNDINFGSLISDYSTTVTVNSENINITINLNR